MRNSELNRSQEYRILVNTKLKNPPIDETVHRLEFMREKLNETLTNWDSLSADDKTCYFKSSATNLFKEWFNRYLGRVDFPPDYRDDRPNATILKIRDDRRPHRKRKRYIFLKFDIGESDDRFFAYFVKPVLNMEDFDHICERILLPSDIFKLSGVLTIIRQHLPPDTRNWITDGQHYKII